MKAAHRLAFALVLAAAGGFAEARSPNVQFAEREVAMLRAYYAPKAAKPQHKDKKDKALPPGLQKKLERDGELPPGLQKRLDRGDSLPPGLAKRALPRDLERRLPALPAGYGRYLAGGDVILVDRRRDIVVDVVFNVLP
jgi:hypothetical protein